MSSETYALPAALDLVATAPLRNDLLAFRGKALTLDASSVERVGALGLQIVKAAAEMWRKDGVPFAVTNPSTQFLEASRLTGATIPDGLR